MFQWNFGENVGVGVVVGAEGGGGSRGICIEGEELVGGEVSRGSELGGKVASAFAEQDFRRGCRARPFVGTPDLNGGVVETRRAEVVELHLDVFGGSDHDGGRGGDGRRGGFKRDERRAETEGEPEVLVGSGVRQVGQRLRWVEEDDLCGAGQCAGEGEAVVGGTQRRGERVRERRRARRVQGEHDGVDQRGGGVVAVWDDRVEGENATARVERFKYGTGVPLCRGEVIPSLGDF